MTAFRELLAEAEAHPLGGWDFSWLGARMRSESPPWDFAEIVSRLAADSPDLLDLGTGGGEFLASLPRRPPRVVATEAWPPNVEVATARLAPLGVEVVHLEPSPDNVEQEPDDRRGRLPFRDGSFSLVIDRHEAYVATEVARVLAPAGTFVTQQLGGDYRDAHEALGLPPSGRPVFDLALARPQLEHARLDVRDAAAATVTTTFADVGAFAWFLRAAPWVVEGFSIAASAERLEQLHRRICARGPLALRDQVFRLEATHPDAPL